MYCIIVRTEVKDGTRERFLEAMLPNAEASVREEPGCHVFDVLEVRDEKNVFLLYEIYSSPDALELHKQTAHYSATRAVVNELIASQSVVRADVLRMNPGR